MNLIELKRTLGQLRLGGIAAVLETRLLQAQAESMAPIDLVSCLISDELTRREVTGCWSGGANKRSFATRKPPWRTSILASTKRSIAVSSSISPQPPSSQDMKMLCF